MSEPRISVTVTQMVDGHAVSVTKEISTLLWQARPPSLGALIVQEIDSSMAELRQHLPRKV
jgi:hypothetical protein